MNQDLLKTLEHQISTSDHVSSDVGEQRERNYRYYTMQPLGNEREGRSHYVDPTVLSSVESKKAIFSETFLSSRDVVKFSSARGFADEARAKTAYVKKVFKRNRYEELLRDAWHDAFVAKRCAVWVEWKRYTQKETLEVNGQTSQAVNAMVASIGDVVSSDISQLETVQIPSIGQQQFIHRGPIELEIDDSYVCMELLPPEKYHRDSEASYVQDSSWVAKEECISRAELKDRGYDPAQIDRLTRDYQFSSREEDTARKAHDRSQTNTQQYMTGGDNELVTVFRTRAWLVIDPDEIEGFTPAPRLAMYEIGWAKGQILRYINEDGSYTPDIEEIDDIGVFEWTELKISHAENGMCTADVEASSQKNLSTLKRGVLDNMHIVNNTRYEAEYDRLLNPRDLLDNAIGGVVKTERIGSVKALDQPQLSPLTLPAIEMMSRDSEERGGMSSLAKGMNSDVIKNQNADSMVERLTNAGTRRVTAAARDFARTFLVPLMQHVVKLGAKYDKSQDQMESIGKIIPIVPSQWRDDVNDMDIAVALTPDEAQSMSQKLLLMHQVKSQDPSMQDVYGIKQRHALYDAVYEMLGIDDTSPFMLSPESPEYMQAQQQKQQMMMQQQQMMLIQQQKQEQMAAFQMNLLKDQRELDWAKFNNDVMDTMHDNNLDDEKFQHEVYVDNAELSLEQEQERAVNVG